jgi:hypothetical protein
MSVPQQPAPEPPPEGKYLGWLNAVKGLTISNVLVIAMLVVVAVPAYFIYRALNDQEILDRFLSNYRELSAQNVACAIREAKYRGGASQWSISTGFAFVGNDRYFIAVALDHQPSNEEMQSFCATLKLIAETVGVDTVKEAVQEVRQ